MVPSTKEQYELVAQHNRSKVPHTVDPPPPRVDKATDLRTIDQSTRSQTTAMENVITPEQADKRHYPAQFLQSLALPVLKKSQDNYYNTANSASTQSLRTYGTCPPPMNSADCAKELENDKRDPGTNTCMERTPSVSLDLKIPLGKEENNFSTP